MTEISQSGARYACDSEWGLCDSEQLSSPLSQNTRDQPNAYKTVQKLQISSKVTNFEAILVSQTPLEHPRRKAGARDTLDLQPLNPPKNLQKLNNHTPRRFDEI